MTDSLIEKAFEIALTEDVSTFKDGAVIYSISFLPSKKNRDKAYEYEKTHEGCLTLDHTVCGQKLMELGLLVSKDVAGKEIQEVWNIASKRFIAEASGNITAFVDGADRRSTFCSVEAEHILKNEKIKTINNISKEIFLRSF